MSIHFDKEDRIFTLHTRNSTYQMQADAHGFLLHLYYGRKTAGRMDYLLTYVDRGFSGNPHDLGNDRTYSLDALPQEFPFQGMGDYRSTACVVRYADQSRSSDLRYAGYEIRRGKYSLPGLPAVYAGETEADTLEIFLKDEFSGLEVALLYGVLPEVDVITRSVRVKNGGGEKLTIEKIQSACLDFVAGDYDLLTFCGRHTMERQLERPRGENQCGAGTSWFWTSPGERWRTPFSRGSAASWIREISST